MPTARLGDRRAVPRSSLHFELAVMGTVVTFDVFDDGGVPAVAVRRHLELACSILQEVDRVFSLWRPMSPINAFRRGEIDLKDLPEEVTDVLASCMIARTLSGGWFDPWAMPGGVDPTGYVKGWAAQRALGVLARSGVKSAIVNAAGDVASIGDLSAGVPFRVGIADPSSPRTLACVMELQGAVATSGTYERGAHLIDPHTRRAGSRLASASVCGPDLGLADALATALCVGGDDVLERICELEGYEALTIGLDGAMSSTPRFPLTDL